MNKKVFFTISLFALIAYLPIQAFSCKNFLQTTQQKIVSTSSCLVNNAWRIAGTASFATAALTTAIIAKATLEDAHFTKSFSSILPQNAARLLFPLGCSIFGLLCFNVHQHMQKNVSVDDILNILNTIQEYREESAQIQGRTYIDDEVESLHNN